MSKIAYDDLYDLIDVMRNRAEEEELSLEEVLALLVKELSQLEYEDY